MFKDFLWPALVLWSLATFLGASASAYAEDGITVAITYFDNTSSDEGLDPLRKGLADMLMTDLAGSSEIRLVERARLEELLKEIKLGEGPFLDPNTAQQMGKGLSADLIITGAFLSMAPTMRIDARVVLVETGEVLHAAKAEGTAEQFFALEAELASALLQGIGATISPMLRVKIARSPTDSLDAMVFYSKGLDAGDRGDNEAASQAFANALKEDPGFTAAQARLDALEERVTEVEDELMAITAGKSQALAETLRLAREGDVAAQYDLGRAYYWGPDSQQGAVQDFDEAQNWFEKSAAQGHPGAYYYLAKIYSGQNLPSDKVLEMLHQSVKFGSPCRAQFALGVYTQYELKQPEEAIQWFKETIARADQTANMPIIISSLEQPRENWEVCKAMYFSSHQIIGEIKGHPSLEMQELLVEFKNSVPDMSPRDQSILAQGAETDQIAWLRKVYEDPRASDARTNLAIDERILRSEFVDTTDSSAMASSAKAIRDLYRISPPTHASSQQLLLWWDRALQADCQECGGNIELVRSTLSECPQSTFDGRTLHPCSSADLAPDELRTLCQQSFTLETTAFEQCVNDNLDAAAAIDALDAEFQMLNNEELTDITLTQSEESEPLDLVKRIGKYNFQTTKQRADWLEKRSLCENNWAPSKYMTLVCLSPDEGLMRELDTCKEFAAAQGTYLLRESDATDVCKDYQMRQQMVWQSQRAQAFCRLNYTLAEHNLLRFCLSPNNEERCQKAQHLYDLATSSVGNEEQRLALLQQATEVCPAASRAYNEIFNIHMTAERWQLALGYVDQSLALEPNNFNAMANRPIILTELGRPEEALDAYTTLLTFDQSDPRPWRNRGWLHLRQGNYALAEADARKSIVIEPSNAYGHTLLANVLLQQGNQKEGTVSLLQCARLGGSDCQEYFRSRGQNWEKTVCLDSGNFSLDNSDKGQWVITRIPLAEKPIDITSVSLFLQAQEISASRQCDPSASIEAAIFVQKGAKPLEKLSFHERWKVVPPTQEEVVAHAESWVPIRLKSQLSHPLTVESGQELFIAYRRTEDSDGATCFVSCTEPYLSNREWIATGVNEPFTWEPVSETIRANLAICVNPGCTWPTVQ